MGRSGQMEEDTKALRNDKTFKGYPLVQGARTAVVHARCQFRLRETMLIKRKKSGFWTATLQTPAVLLWLLDIVIDFSQHSTVIIMPFTATQLFLLSREALTC